MSVPPTPQPASSTGLAEGGPPAPPKAKTRVVVLGSGWGAVSFVKNIDPKLFEEGPHQEYELVLVSPRNYMLFTPLLASAVGGVVSESSIVESIRSFMRGKGVYYEARAVDIDPEARRLTCVKEFCEVCARRKASGASGAEDSHTDADHTFLVPYDILICSVGAVSATFGIPGVKEHCWQLKTMEDARSLRRHISKSLEHACLPGVTRDERRRLLSFAIVGGGPTGVEVAAELRDLVMDEVAKNQPQIKDDISITLLDGLDSLLSSFDPEVQRYVARVFNKSNINVRLGAKVLEVHDGRLDVQMKDGSKDTIPFTTCIWAAGVTMHPLVADIKGKLLQDLQDSRRGLKVDPHLRVTGSRGTIFCVGDAADTSAGTGAALPPTAQVARQEGEYLARLFSRNTLRVREEEEEDGAASGKGRGGDLVPLPKMARPFRYLHLGSLAYLGGQKGVMDLPVKTPFLRTLKGYLGAQTWRLLETFMQVSPRTQWLVANDWVRWFLFGRHMSDI